MKNLAKHTMDSMYALIYDTILPNLKRSGLNIISCNIVSLEVYNDIVSKAGMTSATIAGGEGFWLADPYPNNSIYFYDVGSDGNIGYDGAGSSYGVRPLITVVK